MVTFLKKLFGSASSEAATPARDEAVEYKGLKIQPAPQPEGNQWRLAGYIVKGSEDAGQEHKFVRADLFTSRDEAADFAVRKGKQIIDEQGDRLFSNDGETHPR